MHPQKAVSLVLGDAVKRAIVADAENLLGAQLLFDPGAVADRENIPECRDRASRETPPRS